MKPKFEELKERIKKFGMRNSLLIAPMPTASTSQIMGNNEACEPFTSLIYKRRTLAGEFVIINKHLVQDLLEIGMWNEDLKNKIISNEGSIQEIEEIPENIRKIYKTAWDMSPKVIIDQASDRGVFICQSQSMNLWVTDLNSDKMTTMYFYAWKKGLKTGQYYLRSRRAVTAKKMTVGATSVTNTGDQTNGARGGRGRRRQQEDTVLSSSPPPQSQQQSEENIPMCRRDNPECQSCGS
jgi:ribonucleoside-diphosphate reductase alpha chain